MQVVKLSRWARVHIRHDLGYDVSMGDIGTLMHNVRYSLMWKPDKVIEVKYESDTHLAASPHIHRQE